jgi:hypothetical protein
LEKTYVKISLFQNPLGFDRALRFLRLKPYEISVFNACSFKTGVLEKPLLVIYEIS